MASYRDFLPSVATGDWVRPSDWLPMPVVTEAEEKFVGLHGVWENGDNVVALIFTGNYTVDWGDGVVENVASGVKAEHQYVWGDIDPSTTTSQGYRQVLITVTPNGGNLLTCDIQSVYSNRNPGYVSGFLEVILSLPNGSTGQNTSLGGNNVLHHLIEHVKILTLGNATSMSLLFGNMMTIKKIDHFDTSLINNFSQTFLSCRALKTIPLFNTSNVTTFYRAFRTCSSLLTIPAINTDSATSVQQMFSFCESLHSAPLFNTSGVNNFSQFFYSCRSLNYIPNYSTASTTIGGGSDPESLFAATCSSLIRCEMVFARTVGFAGCNLGRDAIVEIFTNLVDRSATTSATITIMGNRGVADLTAGDIEIATDKNWVVVT